MPLAVAVLVVGLAVLGVLAVAAGIGWCVRSFPRRRPMVLGGVALALGLVVLVLGEVAPRSYAAGLPADDPCLPDGAVIALDSAPIAWQVAGGGIGGTATMDAEAVTALVEEQLVGSPLEDGEPRVTFEAGELVLSVEFTVSVLTLPLVATIEPALEEGALAFHPTGFSAVGLDIPGWAVDLVDTQLQDADSWLSEALASEEDDPCGSSGEGGDSPVRLTGLVVGDDVRVDFELPVA